MTWQDRMVRKQLLLTKGEVLRVKVALELSTFCKHPLGKVGEKIVALSVGGQFAGLSSKLAGLFPEGRIRRWLRLGTCAYLAWYIGDKFFRRM